MGFVREVGVARWPDGIVPFTISDVHFPPGSPEREEILTGIELWNSSTCIRVIPRTDQPYGIRFVSATQKCHSPVGQVPESIGEGQAVSCDVALAGFDEASIAHEIAHALGLLHEHQRPDRDAHVDIHEENLAISEAEIDTNFDIDLDGRPIGPYDCGSIMHYPRTAFGKVDAGGVQATTITPKPGSGCNNIGQRSQLSAGDVRTIHELYGFVDIRLDSLSAKITLADTSDSSPSLVSHGGRLFLGWRGESNEHLNVMFSEDNGQSFRGKAVFGDTSSDTPRLASHLDRLLVAWKGSGNEELNVAEIGIAPQDGTIALTGLVNKRTLSERSDDAPCIVSHAGRLFISWRGRPNENINIMFSEDGGLTFRGKAVFNEDTTATPALLSHEGHLFVAWKGSGNEQLNLAEVVTNDGPAGFSIGELRHKWILAETSDSGPALASNGGRLLLSWRGESNELINVLVVCARLGIVARGTAAKGVTTETSTDAPALAFHNGRSFVAWKGSGNEHLNVAVAVFVSLPITGALSVPTHRKARHSGDMAPSDYGHEGNVELVVPQQRDLVHFFRDNDLPTRPWNRGATLMSGGVQYLQSESECACLKVTPEARQVSLIQGNFGTPGNLELVARTTHPVGGQQGDDSLVTFFFDASTRTWHGPAPLLVDGQPVRGVSGNPALIQSNFGRRGNFELVVPVKNELIHYWRDNDDPALTWRQGATVYRGGVRFPKESDGIVRDMIVDPIPVGVNMLQSTLQRPGDLELIVRMRPSSRERAPAGDTLVSFKFDGKIRQWSGPSQLLVDERPIEGVTGSSALLQSTFGRWGNFELLVPQGNEVVHYFRDNDSVGQRWHRAGVAYNASAHFRSAVREHSDERNIGRPVGVSMIQSSLDHTRNLEALVRVRGNLPDASLINDVLLYIYFDAAKRQWQGPFPVQAAGQAIHGVVTL